MQNVQYICNSIWQKIYGCTHTLSFNATAASPLPEQRMLLIYPADSVNRAARLIFVLCFPCVALGKHEIKVVRRLFMVAHVSFLQRVCRISLVYECQLVARRRSKFASYKCFMFWNDGLQLQVFTSSLWLVIAGSRYRKHWFMWR